MVNEPAVEYGQTMVQPLPRRGALFPPDNAVVTVARRRHLEILAAPTRSWSKAREMSCVIALFSSGRVVAPTRRSP